MAIHEMGYGYYRPFTYDSYLEMFHVSLNGLLLQINSPAKTFSITPHLSEQFKNIFYTKSDKQDVTLSQNHLPKNTIF